MDKKSGNGFIAEVTPIEGLKVMANIPFLENGTYIQDAYDIYKKTQIGAAYTIDGTGTLKVLWTGVSEETKVGNKKSDYTGKIGVAFNLTAVENLNLAIGAKFDIVDEDYKVGELKYDAATKKYKGFDNWGGSKNKAYFALNASYQVSDAMKVSLAGGVKLFKNSDIDPRFGIGGGVDYTIMDGLTMNADVRYISETKADRYDGEDDAVSFLLGVSKGFSNGSLGVGFEGITNGAGFSSIAAGTDDKGKVHDGFMWCVPVVLTFSF